MQIGFARTTFERGSSIMPTHRIFAMPFASVYPHYVAKAEKKGRTKGEVDEVLRWLTGYEQRALDEQLAQATSVEQFITQAPALHPARVLVTGVVCGVRVETVEDPLMRELRRLDKLIDELAKGKSMEKILRKPAGIERPGGGGGGSVRTTRTHARREGPNSKS